MNLFYSNFKSHLYFNRLFLPVLVNNPLHATNNKKGGERSGQQKLCSLSYLHSVVLPSSQPKQRIHVPCPDETFRSVFSVRFSVRVSFRFGFMVASVIQQMSSIELMFGNATCDDFGPLIVMIRIFIQLSDVVFDHGRSQWNRTNLLTVRLYSSNIMQYRGHDITNPNNVIGEFPQNHHTFCSI